VIGHLLVARHFCEGEFLLKHETAAAKAGISVEKLLCNSNASYYIYIYKLYTVYQHDFCSLYSYNIVTLIITEMDDITHQYLLFNV
jgi:hypothetical protein